ncbi:hypothetical protein C8R47DRAFT_708622 [Mycena vitilis]|nr:hypothetical protein C8R47DRAFT_708622 [Mycena vitilis]
MLACLEADRVRVAELGAQIMELEHSLAVLQTEKASAQERLASYRYPILTLPNELTSEILIHFMPVYPLCPPLKGLLSPTLLSQICRRWREVALGTPALWKALSLVDKAESLEKKDQILHLWLSRSRSCPLSVAFDHERGDASEAVVAVASHRQRWEHAALYISPSHIPIVVGAMPLLRHLDLEIDTSPGTFTLSELLLRTVILNDNAALSIVLPWVQLTSLTLPAVFPSECTPVLQRTPNLIYCNLGLAYDAGDARRQPDITLPHLESFVLEGSVSVDRYLETFITPALTSLTIWDSFLRVDAIADFKSFITKSACSLQKVFIMKADLPKATYRNAFPSIQFTFDDDDEEGFQSEA